MKSKFFCGYKTVMESACYQKINKITNTDVQTGKPLNNVVGGVSVKSIHTSLKTKTKTMIW